jgi:EAL domain-containing protein (putative c-di-GMP-specific phosphodiesterase class I)
MIAIDAIVIDDDELQLLLLTEHCLALGMRNVRNYQSAGDAMRALRSGCSCTPETLLVLDLNMPRLDGVEVLRELQLTKFPGRVLLISGEGQRMLEAVTRVARGMGLGVVGALSKPVTRESIRAAITAIPDCGSMPDDAVRKFSVEEVRRAIENDELEVFYQPKVFVGSCEVSGYEALMRWRHPVFGLLGPGAFLEVMETGGLLTAATRVLLHRVLGDRQQLAAAGARVPVAVNIAIGDMEGSGFCDELMAMLKVFRATPHDIHLEVTERGVSKNALASLHSMSRLRLHQIRLAVDDFGTGEASLLRLREYPFDYIKIDRRFVHGAVSDGACRAIYDACSAMAFQLGLGVVAEGVENEADWHFIRRRNCEQAQGYFIGHPMPLSDIRAWTRDWAARRVGLVSLAA